MTNFEKFKKEIKGVYDIDGSFDNLAVRDGKPCHCYSILCKDCEFVDPCNIYDDCGAKAREWLFKEAED